MTKLTMRCGFLSGLVAVMASVSIFAQPAGGQASKSPFEFDDYLLAPVRIHLLSAKDWPVIHTTLAERDITRILAKINGVWSQAGLHFYRESLVNEPANGPEGFAHALTLDAHAALLALRPQESRATNMFHVYYLKTMSMNGIYFPEAVFVKDTASLKEVEGGIDEPLPRVTSHELGHAFGLPHRQNTTNLMASGTTGTWLNEKEINQVRNAAKKFQWIEPAPLVVKAADELFRANRHNEAAELYSRLATIPLESEPVVRAKKRARKEPVADSK